MAEKYAQHRYTGDGVSTDWQINFADGYIRPEYVKAYTVVLGEYIPVSRTLPGPNTVRIFPAVPVGVELLIQRETPKDAPLVDFTNGAILDERTLDLMARQSIHSVAEMVDEVTTVTDTGNSAIAIALAAAAEATVAAQAAAVGADNAVAASEAASQASAQAIAVAAGLEGALDDKANADGSGTLAAFISNLTFQLNEEAEQLSVEAKLRMDTTSLLDYVPFHLHPGVLSGDGTEDMTEYFQKAHDNTQEGHTIRVVGQYEVGGTVNITKSHRWEFEGGQLAPGPTSGGTIVRTVANGSNLFEVRRAPGTEVRGLTFDGLSVFEPLHPSPASDIGPTPGVRPTPVAWSPANYGWLFDLNGTAGEVNITNLYVAGVRKVCKSVASGRTNIVGFIGQVFECLMDIDQAYDVVRGKDWHEWPYLLGNQNVYDWQVANKDLIRFKRCDTPFFDDIFSFVGRNFMLADQVVWGPYLGPYTPSNPYTPTAENPFPAPLPTGTNAGPGGTPISEPGTAHPYSASNVNVGVIYAESYKYALTVKCVGFSMDASVFKHTGDQVDNVPIANGYTLSLEKNDAKLNFGVLKSNRLDKACIYVAGSGCNVQGGAFFGDDINRSGGHDVTSITGASVVSFATSNIRTGNGATMGTVLSPMMANGVPHQANELRAFNSATGLPVSIAPVGSDASISVQIAAKGPDGQISLAAGASASLSLISGGVRLNAASGGNLVTGLLCGTSPFSVPALAPGAVAAVAVGIPNSTSDYQIFSASHSAFIGGMDIGTWIYTGSGNWQAYVKNNTGVAQGIFNGNITAFAMRMST